MTEVPESIVKECETRFGNMVFFKWVPWKERFVAKAVEPTDTSLTYDLFIVEDEFRRYRPIDMNDILRIEKARIVDDSAKQKAKQEMADKLASERREKTQKSASSKARRAAFDEIANDCVKNPIAARGFVNDAKRKYKVKEEKSGNRTRLTPEK